MEYNNNITSLGAQERQLLHRVMEQGSIIVTAGDVQQQLRGSRQHANLVLSRLHAKGWLQRTKAGVYMVIPLSADPKQFLPEEPWALATALFSPCYLTGWTAAQHWDFTEQIFNTTLVYTSKLSRKTEQVIAGLTYRLHHVKEVEIFGTVPIWLNNHRVLMADPHRTLIDCLDNPNMAGGSRMLFAINKCYWNSPHAAKCATLLKYAKKLGRGTVFKRMGFLAEHVGVASKTWLQHCRQNISSGISKLDPSGANEGRIVTRWGLKINIPVENLDDQ